LSAPLPLRERPCGLQGDHHGPEALVCGVPLDAGDVGLGLCSLLRSGVREAEGSGAVLELAALGVCEDGYQFPGVIVELVLGLTDPTANGSDDLLGDVQGSLSAALEVQEPGLDGADRA